MSLCAKVPQRPFAAFAESTVSFYLALRTISFAHGNAASCSVGVGENARTVI